MFKEPKALCYYRDHGHAKNVPSWPDNQAICNAERKAISAVTTKIARDFILNYSKLSF